MSTRKSIPATSDAPQVPRNTILEGDALAVLRSLPSRSVQCVITSPPYYGLRDYGASGQIGLEPTLDDYLAKLLAVFDEVFRVLRPDGTCWINIGDSYAVSGMGGNPAESEYRKQATNTGSLIPGRKAQGFKPKDLMLVPFRLALALQQAGWYVRQTIIWNKPAPMPESVTDRCTTSHEYIFLLTRSERYYYDADAIREPAQDRPQPLPQDKTIRPYKGPNINNAYAPGPSGYGHNIAGRNRRSVWTVMSEPFPDAHYATFPTALIEPMVLAGTSPQACEHCGAPWERVVAVERHVRSGGGASPKRGAIIDGGKVTSGLLNNMLPVKQTTGWRPSCRCKDNTGAGRCLVLDPFIGSGTVGVVAAQQGRDWLGIELNHDYAEMARRRIAEEGRPVVLKRKQRAQMRKAGVQQSSLLDVPADCEAAS